MILHPDRSSFCHLLLALMFLLPLTRVASAATDPGTPLSEEQKAEHVLNRLGYGPRPGDIERIRKLGVQAYIDQQLNPEKINDSALEERLEPLGTLRLSSRELFQKYPRPGQLLRVAQAIREGRRVPPHLRELYDRFLKDSPMMDLPMMEKGTDRRAMMEQMSPEQRRFFRTHSPRRIVVELQQAKLLRAVYSERQLQEQMVDFWMNHFNVHMGKGMGRWLVTSYERDAIRPHALGKFRDLVLATARHPAMLFYLDNFQSSAPNSGGRRGRNRRRGLNENYARELMELHTLGVDGGYTQQDVVEVARCFTGWTFRPRRGAEYLFHPRMHDRGEKRVLGVRIRGGGERDGIRVIDLLVNHPSTARFIATKLVRRFVADEPPESLVRRTTATFRQSGGDIRRTLRTIFRSQEFFSAEAYRAKVKKPVELVASALRASGAEVGFSPPLLQAVARLGEPLYLCEPPTGYPDVAQAWVNAGLMLNRVNFAHRPGCQPDSPRTRPAPGGAPAEPQPADPGGAREGKRAGPNGRVASRVTGISKEMNPMLTRRFFLKESGIAVASLGLMPSFLARAAANNRSRRKNKILIAIFQRGAADGLNMVVPFAERTYYDLRPSIAIPPPRRGSARSGDTEAAMDLNGSFGLHPALAPFYRLYQQGHLAIVHAAGSPHNTRSHFDAQDFMETATPGVKATTDGWLNRHLSSQPRAYATPFRAVALGPALPRILRGRAPALAMSSIREFRVLAGAERLRTLYGGDGSDFLYGTGQEMLGAIDFLRRANPEQYQPAPGIEYPRSRFGQSLRQIAQLIKADIGLEVAFADLGGWDTHARQGSLTGQLPNRLADFSRGIAALYADLGDHMEDVVILTMSEFGRTVAENGNRGTDHGHANAMFVLGGVVRGAKVYGKWPGLAREQLYEGRDLALSTDFRDVFAELIASHLGNQNLNGVFLGFDAQPANFPGLLRA